MKMLRSILVIVILCSCAFQSFAADPFTQWWPAFQTAVAKSDAKAVSDGAQFPMNWENGPVRNIKLRGEFIQHFAKYLTPEIRKIIAVKKPERLPNGIYSITWKARGNEYSIYFKPVAGGTFALDGLSEGPP